MKKINLLALALIAGASITFTSCKKDDDKVEPVVQENDVPNGTQKMVYSVQVIPSSQNAKVAGLADVKVTVNQNGNLYTQTTNSSGIATFDNMRMGEVAVFVEAPAGYLSVNYTGYIDCYDCQYDDLDTEQTEYDSESITLARLAGTVKGKIEGYFVNQTQTSPLPLGTKVIATIDERFQPNVFTTTISDGTGAFTFNNLPEGEDVDFEIEYTTTTAGNDRQWHLDSSVDATPNANIQVNLGTVQAY